MHAALVVGKEEGRRGSEKEEGRGKGGEEGNMHNYHLHDLAGHHSWPRFQAPPFSVLQFSHFQAPTSFPLLSITNYGRV